MNTNPRAKTVLCYGDSNTWGRLPDRSGRYPANMRWPGQLQEILGDSYYVIEEGLGGRTTDIEDSMSPRNGKSYLLPCLQSHEPLDCVVIMLGTNDFKFRFKKTPNDIAESLRDLASIAQNTLGPKSKIVLLSPIIIEPEAPRFKEFYDNDFKQDAGSLSSQLADLLKKVATETGCAFFDSATVAKVGEDGLHLDEESNKALAESLSTIINDI